MKAKISYSIYVIVLAVLLITSCDETGIVKDSPTPSNSQAEKAAAMAVKDSIDHNRYMIMFKEQPAGIASSQQAQQTLQKIAVVTASHNIKADSLIHRYRWATQGFAAHLTPEQVEKLRSDPRVKVVVKDFYFKAFSAVNVNKSFAATAAAASGQITPWGIARLNAPVGSTTNTAWIIDSGIDLYHDDLNVDEGRSASFVATETADDHFGHGTFVAGIIGARDNDEGVVGVSPNATLVAVNVCDPNGCFTSDIKAGVEYAANNFNAGDVANTA